jgi:hypothetical protein
MDFSVYFSKATDGNEWLWVGFAASKTAAQRKVRLERVDVKEGRSPYRRFKVVVWETGEVVACGALTPPKLTDLEVTRKVAQAVVDLYAQQGNL